MKHKVLYAALAAVAVLSCTKAPDEEKYDPDTTLKHQGEVTLMASIEDFSTKAYMPSSGYGVWKTGDEIAVRMDDGSYVTFTLSGTGETVRAFFKGEIPQGRTLGDCAVYPASAVKSVNPDGTVTAEIPQAYNADEFKGIMVAAIEDSWEICFRQMLSSVLVTLENFPVSAGSFMLREEGRSLTGDFRFDPHDALVSGISAPVGDGCIEYVLSKSSAKLGCNVFLPVAEYRKLSVKIFDKNGRTISEQPLLQNPFIAERAAITSIEKTLEVVEGPDDIVTLRGVPWCKCNLQRNAGAAAEGWQAGWELASEPWFTYNYDLKENGKYKYDENAAAQMRFDIDNDHCNHFNFGGIAEPFTKETESFAAPSGDLSISGKMFTDRVCTQETADFAAAAYGDLAYWASKGQYRLPTLEEIETLKECDVQYGHCTAPDGMKIWGLLYTEPADPANPAYNSVDIQITEAMLKDGLFLPCAGRRADSSVTVISYRTQGVYWTGGAVDKSFVSGMSWASSAAGAEYEYSDILEFTDKVRTYGHTKGYAYDRKAGFCIRPVLN